MGKTKENARRCLYPDCFHCPHPDCIKETIPKVRKSTKEKGEKGQ